jgi:hypothetical protein
MFQITGACAEIGRANQQDPALFVFRGDFIQHLLSEVARDQLAQGVFCQPARP